MFKNKGKVLLLSICLASVLLLIGIYAVSIRIIFAQQAALDINYLRQFTSITLIIIAMLLVVFCVLIFYLLIFNRKSLKASEKEFDDILSGLATAFDDLIIVDSNDPFGPSEGLFTREFYGNCYKALKADGIMVNQQGSPFYAEDAMAMQRSHKRIVNTFPISRVYQAHIPTYAAGYWLFGFASKKYHPIDDLDSEAWNALNLYTRYYTTRLHKGAFWLPAFLEEMLQDVED